MKNEGFTLIELIIAIGLAAIFIPAIVYVFSFSLGAAGQGEKYTQAYALAQEQMEIIYHLKDQGGTDWDWELTPPTSLPALGEVDGFTRKIEISEVYRCGLDICNDGTGLKDPFTRKITVSIGWIEKAPPAQEVKLESYVTQH